MAYETPITIVGFGNVGQHLAYKLIGEVPEISVYTRGTRQSSLGALGDLQTASVIDGRGTRIRRIDEVAEIPRDALVIQTAKEGYDYKDYPPEDIRIVGLKHDPPLIRRFSEDLAASGFHGRYINITNPANVMAGYAQNFLDLPTENVLAFGSALDTGRFTQQLIEKVRQYVPDVAPGDIEGGVVGEHGPKMVFPESTIRVRGQRLEDVGVTHEDVQEAAMLAMQDGPRIATMQGGTWYAPVEGMLRSIDFLLSENHAKVTEGVFYKGQYIGVPVSKENGQVQYHIDDLTSDELALVEESLAQVQNVYNWVMKDFNSRKQRRDILVLDDEPGLALSMARRLSDTLEDDEEMSARNRFFFGYGESRDSFVENAGGVWKLADVRVTDDPYDPQLHSRIVGGPDVAIFDFLIGGEENGFEVARHIKEQYQNTRVIINTAHAKWHDVVDMVNTEFRTRSGKLVKVADAVVSKDTSDSDALLEEKVKSLLRETQFRTA